MKKTLLLVIGACCFLAQPAARAANVDLSGLYLVSSQDTQTDYVSVEVARHGWDTYYFDWHTSSGQVVNTIVYVDNVLHKIVDTTETKYNEIGRNNTAGIEYTVNYQSTSTPGRDYRLEANYRLNEKGDLLWHAENFDLKGNRTQVIDHLYKKNF